MNLTYILPLAYLIQKFIFIFNNAYLNDIKNKIIFIYKLKHESYRFKEDEDE